MLSALDYNIMRVPTLGERVERMAEEVLKGDMPRLGKLCNYYSRMVVYDYALMNAFSAAELAVSALWVAIEAHEMRCERRIMGEGLLARLMELSGVSVERLGLCSGAIKELEAEFSIRFSKMNNLKRFFGTGTTEEGATGN